MSTTDGWLKLNKVQAAWYVRHAHGRACAMLDIIAQLLPGTRIYSSTQYNVPLSFCIAGIPGKLVGFLIYRTVLD